MRPCEITDDSDRRIISSYMYLVLMTEPDLKQDCKLRGCFFSNLICMYMYSIRTHVHTY